MILYYLHLILTLENKKSVSYMRDVKKEKIVLEESILEENELDIPEVDVDEKKFILLLNWEEYHKIQKRIVTQNQYSGTHGYGTEPFESKIFFY